MSRVFKIILLVFEEISTIFFPLSSDELLIKNVSLETFTHRHEPTTRTGVIILSAFKEPTVRAAIHLVKFHRHSRAQLLLATLLADWLKKQPNTNYIVMPVPLSIKRQRERGYNQVELIVRQAIANLPGWQIECEVLTRPHHRKPQSSLKRQERLKNVTGAFGVSSPGHSLAGQHVIIVDDVSTTGATLGAAKAALLPLSPASVTCVALAG